MIMVKIENVKPGDKVQLFWYGSGGGQVTLSMSYEWATVISVKRTRLEVWPDRFPKEWRNDPNPRFNKTLFVSAKREVLKHEKGGDLLPG
jgi:hypothetical protein